MCYIYSAKAVPKCLREIAQERECVLDSCLDSTKYYNLISILCGNFLPLCLLLVSVKITQGLSDGDLESKKKIVSYM